MELSFCLNSLKTQFMLIRKIGRGDKKNLFYTQDAERITNYLTIIIIPTKDQRRKIFPDSILRFYSNASNICWIMLKTKYSNYHPDLAHPL